jgi:hypothetical protein
MGRLRTITSDPKPSHRTPGYLYAYYDATTRSGKDCVVVFPSSMRGVVRAGYTFRDDQVSWDDAIGASVLACDFSQAPDDPALPPSELGWCDPDHFPPAEPPAHHAPQAMRPATHRRQQAAELGSALPVELLEQAKTISSLYRTIATLIGVSEPARAMEAKSLAITLMIPYLKKQGILPLEDDGDFNPERM